MSTSSDPERGGRQPDDSTRGGQPGGTAVPSPGGQPAPGPYQPYGQPDQYGQPGAYSPYGPPGRQGNPDPYRVPSHGLPYGDRGGYVYSPYGTMPAGPTNATDDRDTKVARPGIMVLALVLLALSALPWLLAGVSALVNPDPLLPFLGTQQQFDELRAQGVEPVAVVRVLGVVLLVGSLLYLTFAALAFAGHNWARIVLAIMTTGFAVLLVASFVVAPVAGAGLILLVVAAAVAGTVILFLPGPNRYITARRR